MLPWPSRAARSGVASVTLTQQSPAPGTNEVQFTAVRPAMKDECRCWPESVLEGIPLRRHGDPETDIGATIVFLAGPGTFITGRTLHVDGGSGTWR